MNQITQAQDIAIQLEQLSKNAGLSKEFSLSLTTAKFRGKT
jgi:hypothetical protein